MLPNPRLKLSASVAIVLALFSVRADGRVVVGEFAAALDGVGAPVVVYDRRFGAPR